MTSTARAKSETRDQTRMTTLTLSFVSAPARSRVETSKPRGARLRHPFRIPKNTRDLSAAITSSGSSSWAGPPHSPSEVYIARVPLVGLEALEWGLGDKYPGELDHTMVLVRHLECETDANGTENCTDWNALTCYDFLPEEPASPATAATLLSGGSVKGKLRTRTLRGIPKRKCEFVGQAVVGQRLGDGVDCQREIDARCAEFQKEWDPNLSLKDHSCREHSAALASMLTGKEVTSEKIGAHVTPAFSA